MITIEVEETPFYDGWAKVNIRIEFDPKSLGDGSVARLERIYLQARAQLEAAINDRS